MSEESNKSNHVQHYIDKVLSTDYEPPEPNQSIIQITKTNVVEMHYLILPIEDLNVRFLYRLVTPVATVWRKGFVGHDLSGVQTLDTLLKEYALKQWYKLLTKDMQGPLPAGLEWAMEVDSAKLVECEIVLKDNMIAPRAVK